LPPSSEPSIDRGSAPAADAVEKLAAALTDLGLARAGSLKEVETSRRKGARPSPAFLVSPRLRLAQHYDLDVDLLVYDPGLGTVALVHRLVESAAGIAAEVQGRIDQATYVRHLLLVDRRLDGRLPLTVELVFLARDEPDHLDQIGRALGRVARETAFLEAVGVNLLLLPRDGGEPFSKADLRRAFPWLLQATRAWYDRPPDDRLPARPKTAARSVAGIELQDYRLSGRRKLALEPAQVHLIFGRNGSGKSSLVEALELAVTGTAERLAGEADFTRVIRNRHATGPARVILHFRDAIRSDHEVVATGIADPLRGDLKATAFRLDQPVMDRLTRGGDVERAAIFLRSFFPHESADFLAFQQAREAAEKALGQIPAALRDQLAAGHLAGEDPAKAVVRQLAWLDEPERRLEPEVAAACLPLPPATLAALGPLSSELAQLQAAWSLSPPRMSEAAATLGRIDEALERVRGELPATLEILRIAREGLQRVEGWLATGGAAAGGDFLADCNDWLRRCALTDLAERHCQLLEALEEARRAGWEPEPGTLGPFAQPPAGAAELAAQRRQAAEWARERDEIFQRLMAVAPSTGGAPATTPSAEVARPSRAQRDRLDAAGRWLLPAPTDPSRPALLGQAIEQALGAGAPVQVGDVAVGHGAGWARPLLDRLGQLEAAGRALQEAGSHPGNGNLQAMKDALARYRELDEAGGKVGQSFLRQLRGEPGVPGSGLVEALNELMALFTPARWAYEEIDLEYRDGQAGGTELGFEIGDRVQAALSLNTAQLNLFTVALFLLCALRADNPLGLLVLDDPLQNMDELTVTTLARGLAKIQRLWEGRWQLLLFFHGQEDRERFSRELPVAVYQLPWLSPGEGSPGEEIEIPADEVLYGGGLQSLTTVARARSES
jgi:energy-coupling factor transporter ATP-binding protein EcfA2